jgi:hypothetical protein
LLTVITIHDRPVALQFVHWGNKACNGLAVLELEHFCPELEYFLVLLFLLIMQGVGDEVDP